MSAYLDTSALIRAFRLGLAPRGLTRSHSLAEFYCVLTGPGLHQLIEGRAVKTTFAPAEAAAEARRTFAHVTWCDVKPEQALRELDLAVAANIHGKNVHDWMHAAAARLAKADRIVTLNGKHFRAMTELRVVSPEEFFAK